MSKRRVLLLSVGVAVSGLCIWLALRGIDFKAVEHAFASAQLWPWLPLALAIYGCGHLLRGIRCRMLVRHSSNISLTTAVNVIVVGYAANNVLPARLGELVRAGMLAERARMPVSQSLGITFIERVLDGLALLLMLVVATWTGTVPQWMNEVVYVALGVFGAATIVMLVGALRPSVVIGLTRRIGGLFGASIRDKLVKLATNVTNAGACLRDPKHALGLAALSIVIWCFEGSLFVFALPIFGIELNVQYGIITMCVTGFALLLPSSPGFIGPFHYFASKALMVYGISQPVALAYATLVHLCFYVPVTIWGACAMAWYGVELGQTAERARQQAAESVGPGAVDAADAA